MRIAVGADHAGTPMNETAIAELRADRNAVLAALSEADTLRLLATRFRNLAESVGPLPRPKRHCRPPARPLYTDGSDNASSKS